MKNIIEMCKKFGYYKNSRMRLYETKQERFPWAIEHTGQGTEMYETLYEAAYDFNALVEQYGN